MTSFIENLPSAIRWILVIPASIVAYLLVYFLNNISMYFTFGYVDPDSLFKQISDILINSFVSVGASIYAAFFVAPSKKKATTIVISFVWAGMAFFGLFTAFSYGSSIPVWQVIVSALLVLAVCVIMCMTVPNDEQSKTIGNEQNSQNKSQS